MSDNEFFVTTICFLLAVCCLVLALACQQWWALLPMVLLFLIALS